MTGPSSEVTGTNQTQPQTCVQTEPSFAEVVKIATAIRFCDSRCSIAIETFIKDVERYRKFAKFSDMTSNLILQIRCSSDILETSNVTVENSFEENCRCLRETFGVTYKEARQSLMNFIRKVDEEPIDAFYRLESILKTPVLKFNRMDDDSRLFWISESITKILPTEPYRHFCLLWRQEGETDNLSVIRRLLKKTMEVFPSIHDCNMIDSDYDTQSENNDQIPEDISHLQDKLEQLEGRQVKLQEELLRGFKTVAETLNNQYEPQNSYHHDQEDDFIQNQPNLCETCVNAGYPRYQALHLARDCPNTVRLGNELYCSSTETFRTLPRARMRIGGKSLLMLIDSGANVNLISEAAAANLPFQRIDCWHTIRVASGNVITLRESFIADIEFPNGILGNITFVICPTLSHDVVLGTYVLRKFSIDLDAGTAILQGIHVDLAEQGTPITCSLAELVTIEPESYTKISFPSPLPEYIREDEPAIILQNLDEGYLYENDLQIIEGVYNHSEVMETYVFNPNPYAIEIPKNIPILQGSTLEATNDHLESNELIEVHDNPDHALAFQQHLEFRRRKFDPENSNSISKIHIGPLDESKSSGLNSVLEQNKFAFSVNDYDIGMIRDYQFAINWKNEDAEVYHKPRQVNPAMRDKANEKIESWKEMGVIEPSSSHNNIPLFFIKKGTKGDIRPILDCRAVNLETIANRFPIPHLKDLLSNISRLIGTHGKENLYISTTDIQSAFNQLVVQKEDRSKCAFSYNNRQWQAARCLFGLRNAPSAFCEVMARVLDGLDNVFVLLDDVLIISTDWEDHLHTLDQFFQKCIENGITLKPSKTYLAAESIDYLGFRLSKEGIEPLKSKIEPIINYPLPRTRRQLQRFIGMTNFYSRFVRESSRLLAPL